MKKILTAFIGLAMIAGIFTITSCEKGATEQFGPKNMWCEKEIEYRNSETETATLDAYLLYCDGTYKPTTTMVENDKFDWTKEALYIVVTNRTTSDTAKFITKDKYAVLVIGKDSGISESDTDADTATAFSKFKATPTKWSAICIANPSIQTSASPNVPFFLKKGSGYKEISDIELKAENFSWKKILAQILLEKVLED